MSRRNAPESKQADLFPAAKLPSPDTSLRDASDQTSFVNHAPVSVHGRSKPLPSGKSNSSAGNGNSGKPPPKVGKRTAGGGPGQFLTVKQVAARYGVAVSTIWRWLDELEDFPKPVRLGSGATRWVLDELLRYEAELPRIK